MTNETKYWYLKNHQLFDELSRNAINEICYLSHFRMHRKGDVINLSQDEDRVYTLKVGILKIVELDTEGNEQLVEVLRPDDLFGQFTLTPAETNQYAVVLSDYVTFCSFLVTDFERVIQQHPSLGIRFTKLVGLRLRRLENRYINLMYKDVRTRFRLFLKEWVEKDAKPDQPYVLNNYLTHKDISRMICSNRQVVSELFSEYRQAGMLEYNRSQIIITNPALLDVA
ncbi:CRP/FNR family transcriptional regulator, anaerobic regulatory protein [Fibrisoma limi BUZ 3]|uniref:CRP/FNR family transcriptional regulator, anaerobic regulatory protein n=1 Tax=Fibrisoma limi BUZ 3 TaxID=1185876 RepID=I2GGB1_9BACT|nr:Crp/Fnr family transcriptional regulator [Fibrisoma limi]CCH52936.1 CRP/FNR family transcriptional regulator, anaerobic regulatory protein [Fibrisoma limi BUZ 3]